MLDSPRHPPSTPPDTTVVVPTFNEGGNVAALVDQLAVAFEGRSVEVLFVDDSTDSTPDIIRQVSTSSDLPVRLLHRAETERVGGLSGAVTHGLREAAGEFVIVMDGDLQHPPALAPFLRDTAYGENVDMVVASRYCGEGDASGLSSSMRRAVSSGSTLLSRLLFPHRVGRKCTDPMTGFFCVRSSAMDLDRLRPRGFKILLEILASHDLHVREVPFVFGERLTGESKASWKNGLIFLRQVMALRLPRTARFALVGALGLVVNLLVMAALIRLDLNYVLASVMATQVAIAHNFLMQERFVFHDLRSGHHARTARAWRSALYNNLDNIIRVPLLVLLVERGGLHSVLAQALTLAVSFSARFFYTAKVVYRPVSTTLTVPVLVEEAEAA